MNNTRQGGVGFLGILWLIVITLKLMSILTWSWWIVVFFPFIIIAAITGVCLGLVGLGLCFTDVKLKRSKSAKTFKLG